MAYIVIALLTGWWRG